MFYTEVYVIGSNYNRSYYIHNIIVGFNKPGRQSFRIIYTFP